MNLSGAYLYEKNGKIHLFIYKKVNKEVLKKALVETNGDCLVATFVDGVDYIGSDNLSNIERNCNNWVNILTTPYEKVKLNITRLRYYDLLEFAKYQLSQIEVVYDNSDNSLCCIVMITIVIFTVLPIILINQ